MVPFAKTKTGQTRANCCGFTGISPSESKSCEPVKRNEERNGSNFQSIRFLNQRFPLGFQSIRLYYFVQSVQRFQNQLELLLPSAHLLGRYLIPLNITEAKSLATRLVPQKGQKPP